MSVQLEQFVNSADVVGLIQRARCEDLGETGDDVTSRLFIAAHVKASASFRSRVPGVLSGAALLPRVAAVYDGTIAVSDLMRDGMRLECGTVIANISGPLRSVTAMERIALNFMTHLSGVATLTASYVDAVAGTKAQVCDTRKTIPGLRGLQKYAVACGGGTNHRIGLHDAVLIKDNHIAHIPPEELGCELTRVFAEARGETPAPKFIEVEVDTLDQLRIVLACGPDMVLLDNMSNDELRQAVSMRDADAPGVLLEASGCVSMETVGGIAQAGVDRISVGALTHSAPTLDIGLDIDQ